MIRTILAALDGTPRASEVIRAAAGVGARFEATLYVLRVVEIPAEFPPAARVSQPDILAAHLRAGALDDLARLSQGLSDVKVAAPIVRAGDPWREIVDAADELGVDLVVMGSHGYGGWDRILGTTAAKVVNHARCSVLIVRDASGGASDEARRAEG